MAPPPVAGRCVLSGSKLHAQVAAPSVPLAEAVDRVAEKWGPTAPKPTVVGRLPESVTVPELAATAELTGEPWRIPVGVRESDLGTAVLEVYEGEHVLVAGPARSGKSTLLLAMAEALRAGARADGEPLTLWGVCGRRSPLPGAGLDRCVGEQDVPALAAAARVHRGRLVLIVDDAEQVADSDQSIANLLAAKLPHLHLVVAGRSDDLRSLYGHWTNTVRKSRCGVLLQPNVDYDGDLLGAPLPRRAPSAVTTGRGYLAQSGLVDFAQLAGPSGGTD
jgi:S-DNA-T family DNA segregation ATPase FtsK/SpoIIIE